MCDGAIGEHIEVVVVPLGGRARSRGALETRSLAVEDAGARAQACQRLGDQREAMGEIVARSAIEPHPLAVLAGNDAKAVVLDFMPPARPARGALGGGWKAGFDEAGRCLAGGQQHVENQITGRRPQVESVNCPLTIRWQPWRPHGDHPSTGANHEEPRL